MSFLDEALKLAAQAAATAVGGPLAGLAAKELVEEALEEEKKDDDEPKPTLQP
jgi:ribosomal protein L12E/L44/L45/RPP1/RPP2